MIRTRTRCNNRSISVIYTQLVSSQQTQLSSTFSLQVNLASALPGKEIYQFWIYACTSGKSTQKLEIVSDASELPDDITDRCFKLATSTDYDIAVLLISLLTVKQLEYYVLCDTRVHGDILSGVLFSTYYKRLFNLNVMPEYPE